ncbi:NAD(P)/FAD-dependent oxidoreductase [Streptomyces sp. NPDC059564]|uniref:NAD(P)/FAD-dependent oxidoreductase n=1 Tax=Streptomyces sp. NPDC059564 TaxID=3346865 RepID=UPI0036A9FBEB
MTERGRPSTAVVGGGVAGLTAAYVLAGSHDVTLYEADDRLGGHAHTHRVEGSDGLDRAVDSGFTVYDDRTCPHLLRLFRELGVATRPATLSMSVRCDGCGLEYAGAPAPRGLSARPRCALRPACLRMLARVPDFHRRARRLLAAPPAAPEVTLGEFLELGGFGPYFTGHFVVPLLASVWAGPPDGALAHPARHLFRLLSRHGLLSVGGSPRRRTVEGGSARYVERIREVLGPGAVRAGARVRSLSRTAGGVWITTADGAPAAYDAVVVAVHADQALGILADPTDAEREVLGAIRHSRTRTVLHTDASVLPRAAGALGCLHHRLSGCRPDGAPVQVSYDMNRLQGLAAPEPYVVTLNAGEGRVRPERVLAEMDYEHPLYTAESVAARRRLPALSGPVTAFAGAYHGWGSHEDGCRSGVAAAAALGVVW